MDQSGETGQTDAQDGNVEKVAISQSGSQMRNPRLPQELLDMIVDNLCYERNTLHSLALVCHAFAPKAQRHLHRRVHLVRDISKLQRAADVYTSPTLLAYVQELVVDLPPYSGDEHAALAAVTPIFASVNRLVLRGCLGVKGSREFKKGYDFLANFRAIQSLSLIDFTPPYPSGFYDMLCNFPCISSLQISGLSLNPPGEAQIPGQTFTALPQTRDILPCLQNLSLTRISLNIERELVTWLSTVIRPGGCTTLQLDLANFTPANALIRHCGANLVHLGVHSWPLVGGSRITTLCLDDNTSLRTLHVTSNFVDSLPRLKNLVQAGRLPCLTRGTLRELHLSSVLGVPLLMFFAQVEEFLRMLGQLSGSPAANLSIVLLIRAVHILGSKMKPVSLADDIARLEAPIRERFCPGTVRSISVCWSI